MSKHKPRTLTEDQIRAYQEGKLSGREAHEVERAAFDSDFEAEALEGLSSLPASEWGKDLSNLRTRLATKKKSFPYLQIAAVASLLILATLSLWFFKDQNNDSLAYQETPQAKEEVEQKVDAYEVPISVAEEDKKDIPQKEVVSKPQVAQKVEEDPEPKIEVESDVEEPEEISMAIADAEEAMETLEEVEFLAEETLVMEEAGEAVYEEDIGALLDVETESAPTTQMPAAAKKVEKAADKDARSRLSATGAVSRSAAAPNSIEILDCNPADGQKNRSFHCASPEDIEALPEYLITNKTTPEYGAVLLEILIDDTGAIESIQVPNSRNHELENEVIRLLQAGPKWMPARMNGGSVSSKVILGVFLTE